MSTDAENGLWKAVQTDVAELLRSVDGLKVELRQVREKEEKQRGQMLLDILDVLDVLERVFANIEPRLEEADKRTRIWVGNFRTAKRELERVLTKHGVAAIEAPDSMVVPGLHTVMETREQLDLDDGTILDVLKRGYLWQGKVLRTAQVIAVKN